MERDVYKIYNTDDFSRLTRGIRLAQCMGGGVPVSTPKPVVEKTVAEPTEPSVSTKLFCSYCDVGFRDQVHQREHYKLDWHRYNLKLHLAGRASVSEEDFDLKADRDDVSSISGSESDSDSEDSDEEEKRFDLPGRPSSVRVFFENDDNKIFSMHRCLLHAKKESPGDLAARAARAASLLRWAVVMLGGGHFAAAVFHGADVVAHKTFHCYTVRKGQGGAQSSRDAKSGGSHPKSAGASLRRYNEASLTQHIQEILSSWSESLAECDLVFYRAPGHNAAALFSGRAPPLDRADPRLRGVPFPTRRATFSEVKRAHDVLATVQLHGMASDFPLSMPQIPRYKLKKPSAPGPNEPGSPDVSLPDDGTSPSQRPDRARSREMVVRDLPDLVAALAVSSEDSWSDEGPSHMVHSDVTSDTRELAEYSSTQRRPRKPRARKPRPKQEKVEVDPEVKRLHRRVRFAISSEDCDAYEQLMKENVEEVVKYVNEFRENDGNYLLHNASAEGKEKIVWTLLASGADPTIRNKRGQPGYACASDKATRNAYRRFMAEYPDKYDYSKSQIPSVLTDEIEREQAEKRRAIKAAKRERDKEKRKEEKERKKEEEEKERFLKLSDREKRALAAERRLLTQVAKGASTAPVVARCFLCAVDITGKVPFEYDIHRFCSITCLKAHRMAHKTTL